MYNYILKYTYRHDGITEIGQTEFKAKTMLNAVYQFYCCHGFKYEVTGWGIKREDD